MANLTAYLRFNGNCREAFMFYKGVFEKEPEIMIAGESPMASELPAEVKDKVMHATLNKGNIMLMGSDMIMSSDGIKKGNNVSLCLICESKKEIETLFKKLSNGGKITNPLKEEFFGIYGDLTDKFGFNWMFQFDNK